MPGKTLFSVVHGCAGTIESWGIGASQSPLCGIGKDRWRLKDPRAWPPRRDTGARPGVGSGERQHVILYSGLTISFIEGALP